MASDTSQNFLVQTPLEFLQDVEKESAHAKIRFWAQAMEVEPGKHTDILLEALAKKAKEGIDTRLHVDYYSVLVTRGVFNYWPFVSSGFRKYRRKTLAAKRAMLKRLTEAGVTCLLTNPPTLVDAIFPMHGRNHMKMVIIDDIAWIGGVNFHDENFMIQDCMIKITDEQIASEIAYVYSQIDQQIPLRDMGITCTDETTLLIDSGRVNQSIIMRQAIERIQQAKRMIKLISPLIPDAELLLALKTSQNKGRKIEIIAPVTTAMTGMYFLVDFFNELLMKLRGIHLPIHFKPFMLHAKILIVDDEEVMIGSHNFSSRGVRMGTEEIAIRSRNKALLTNIRKFYEQLDKQ